MISYFPVVTGSLSVSGSVNISGGITASGGITISGSIASASFASTASFVALAQSASNAVSAATASFANTLTVAGNLTAQTLVVQTITSSVDFVTGSTRFGSILGNTHTFTGSVLVTGSIITDSVITSNTTIGAALPNTSGTSQSNGLRLRLTTAGDSTAVIDYGTAGGNGGWIQATNKSDLATNYNLLLNPNGGNIGVGTTSPNDFIDAGLGLAIISTSGRTGLSIGSTQGTANEVLGRLSFTNTNSTNIGSKRLAYISGVRGTTNNSAYLEFGTANDGLGSQRMVISQAGNIGIGVSSPRASLQVSNSTEGIATIPSLGQTGSYTSLYLTNLNPSYGLLMGSINNGNSWIQVQRTDGSATAYDLQLQPNGGSVNIGSTLITPRQLGKSFSQTSGGGTGTSIIDTGITYNTGDFGGYGRGVTYQVAYVANPNQGGSAGYFAQYMGILMVYTGYNGSAVTTYIQYTQLAAGNNIGGLTLTPVFWNGSSEVSTVGVYTTGYQIRLKISGYNSSFTGGDQSVYLTRLM